MAKKRRLSKRDRKLRDRINSYVKWPLIMKDAEFNKELFELIAQIDPTMSGMLEPDKYVLKYYTFGEEGISNVYYVAFADGDKATVAEESYPAFEVCS